MQAQNSGTYASFTLEECVAIRKIPLCQQPLDPKRIWHFSKDGELTVNSVYYQLQSISRLRNQYDPSTSRSPPPSFWKMVSSIPVPPKVRNFIWRACTNSLATRVNLYARGSASSPLCPLCHQTAESVEHLIFLCPYAATTWFGSRLGFSPNANGFESLWLCLQYLQKMANHPDQMELRLAYLLSWYIWKARNKAVFEHIDPEPEKTFKRAQNEVEELCSITVPQRHSLAMPQTIH
ncbi:uncharacterized protein LOC131169270 [Hevea brasiliensis]|nr:uncharacterized protein LOC131169270 [Hevea brasiliensis]